MSVSSTPLRWPWRANANARLTAIVDLPTPPFAEDTAITFRTSRMLRFSGKPRCRRGSAGGAPERGNPWRQELAGDFNHTEDELQEGSHAAEV